MNFVYGNIVDLIKSGNFNATAHGCNCQNTMGSGVAKALRIEFPQIYEADCSTTRGDFNKLGNYTVVDTEYRCKIYNIYQQYYYGKDGKQYVVYPALELGLLKMSNSLPRNSKILLPRIACSLAGGSWTEVEKIISRTLELNHDVTICDYKQ